MSDPDKKSATGREESLTHDRPKTGPAAAESQQDSSEFIETERFHSDVLEPPKPLDPIVVSSGDAVSKTLLLQVRTLVRPYFGKKPVFARSERDDVRQLLMNQGFVPLLRPGEVLTGLTPYVRFADKPEAPGFPSKPLNG